MVSGYKFKMVTAVNWLGSCDINTHTFLKGIWLQLDKINQLMTISTKFSVVSHYNDHIITTSKGEKKSHEM